MRPVRPAGGRRPGPRRVRRAPLRLRASGRLGGHHGDADRLAGPRPRPFHDCPGRLRRPLRRVRRGAAVARPLAAAVGQPDQRDGARILWRRLWQAGGDHGRARRAAAVGRPGHDARDLRRRPGPASTGALRPRPGQGPGLGALRRPGGCLRFARPHNRVGARNPLGRLCRRDTGAGLDQRPGANLGPAADHRRSGLGFPAVADAPDPIIGAARRLRPGGSQATPSGIDPDRAMAAVPARLAGRAPGGGQRAPAPARGRHAGARHRGHRGRPGRGHGLLPDPPCLPPRPGGAVRQGELPGTRRHHEYPVPLRLGLLLDRTALLAPRPFVERRRALWDRAVPHRLLRPGSAQSPLGPPGGRLLAAPERASAALRPAHGLDLAGGPGAGGHGVAPLGQGKRRRAARAALRADHPQRATALPRPDARLGRGKQRRDLQLLGSPGCCSASACCSPAPSRRMPCCASPRLPSWC